MFNKLPTVSKGIFDFENEKFSIGLLLPSLKKANKFNLKCAVNTSFQSAGKPVSYEILLIITSKFEIEDITTYYCYKAHNFEFNINDVFNKNNEIYAECGRTLTLPIGELFNIEIAYDFNFNINNQIYVNEIKNYIRHNCPGTMPDKSKGGISTVGGG